MTALPRLERELHAAATRRTRRRRARRAGLALSLVGAAAATSAAASGWLTVERGSTSQGNYEIRTAPAPRQLDAGEVTALGRTADRVCLELRFQGLLPSFGCGEPPTRRPLGLAIVDQNAEPGQRLVYGLVSADVAEVRVGATPVTPRPRAGLPGRFFSALVPARGPVHVVALDDRGQPIDELGSPTRPPGAPHSRAEARAIGDPAGFAPTARPPAAFVHQGREISGAAAARRGLTCNEDASPIVHCYDSLAAADAAHRRWPGG